MTATLRGRRVAFLARHGAGHRILPSELNFRANIYGFKLLGVERIFSASAVGSLKEEYPPLDVVVPDQFFDRTRGRISTFFGGGIAGHVSFAHPVCPDLSRIAFESAQAAGAHAHRGGTYVCIEGPQFSTLAESQLYRSWGMDVIGMTNLQEAKLAREAEICYTTIALVTDYDCWHPEHDHVTVDMIVANLHPERRDGAEADRGGCRARAGRARLRVRQRAGGGDHHEPRRDSRGHEAGSRPDHRQVRQVRCA